MGQRRGIPKIKGLGQVIPLRGLKDKEHFIRDV
jgi:hypothetical protein